MPYDDMADKDELDDCDDVLGWADARKYRTIVARLNYLAPNRGDILFPIK